MLNCGKAALCSLLFVVAIKSSAGFWDFWPFNTKTATTPSVKIIPETDGNFIHINNRNEPSDQVYIDSMNRFLEPYKHINLNHGHGQNVYNCKFDNPPPPGQYCDFDVRDLGPCSSLNDFSFRRSSPCLLLTLSQVLDWTPDVLNRSDITQLPNSFSTIPANLNASLARSDDSNEKYVWLSCDGDIDADKEFIGPVRYYPHRGFPTYYFPFKNVPGYLSPTVAVHFERPERGVVITIIWKAWAKNIPLVEEEGLGFVKFHLLID